MAFIRARSPGRTRVPSVTAPDLHSPELARDHLAFGLVRVQVQVCNQFAVETAANKTAVGTATRPLFRTARPFQAAGAAQLLCRSSNAAPETAERARPAARRSTA